MGKFGIKRPDLVLRNKLNNPVWNIESRKKMIASLTGKKQSEEAKNKRSRSLKKFYKENPEEKNKRVKILHEKYTNKINGTGWRKIREKYLLLYPVCNNCGISREEEKHKNNRDLEVNHKNHIGTNMKSRKLFDNGEENLETLCKKCHASESSNYRWNTTVVKL